MSEAAGYLGMSPEAVRQWTNTGRLACIKTAGGHRRYRKADLDAVALPITGPRRYCPTCGQRVEDHEKGVE